jgi:hypothetical protein
LAPLDLKLRFCSPSIPGWLPSAGAEGRTFGHSSTGTGTGEKRFDLLLTTRTGSNGQVSLLLGLEVVSTEDVKSDSLKHKVGYLMEKESLNSDARRAMLVMYMDNDKPLAQMVLHRQVINAILTSSSRLRGDVVTVYTYGVFRDETPDKKSERWSNLAVEAEVEDNVEFVHLPRFSYPVDPGHSFRYCIHPKEMEMLHARCDGLVCTPVVW